MADLRAKINHHSGRKDSRININRQCERRRNIEGRNLEKDFDSHTLVHGSPVSHVPLPPSSPVVLGGGVHGAYPTPVYGGLTT
jgi:hypothetical protein